MSLAFRRIAQCHRNFKIYKSMGIQLCDVSLRDGLQTENAADWSTQRKKALCLEIMNRPEKPEKIEVGSLVSKHVFPIMEDTSQIHYYADYINSTRDGDVEPFVLVPSFAKMKLATEYGYGHLSFISSVSDAFQLKNTGVSVDRTILDLNMSLHFLKIYAPHMRTKLYLSCITECPISGRLSSQDVLFNCMRHMYLGFDELCLSDTCGTLTSAQFVEIIEGVACLGYPLSKISLHLHADNTNAAEVDNILRYSFTRGIRMFDVSSLSSGGCSRTMSDTKTKPNLSYELFFGSLEKYILGSR